MYSRDLEIKGGGYMISRFVYWIFNTAYAMNSLVGEFFDYV